MINIIGIIISILTLLQMLLYGLPNRIVGPVFGIFVSLCWIVYCYAIGNWGLQFLNGGMIVIHIWNIKRGLVYGVIEENV